MSQPLRVLIVDDEPLARARLRQLLAEPACGAVAVVAEAGDADAALALLQSPATAADMLLLDIAMPGRSGLALAQALSERGDAVPQVVFVTAHSDHALAAFALDAAHYLTKPVQRDQLAAALARVRQRVAAAAGLAATTAPADALALVVTERGRVLRVPVAEVVYLKAQDKYVTLVTTQRRYVVDETLAELEQRLGAAALRTHRHTVVQRDAVRALERRVLPGERDPSWAVQTALGDDWLPVSRRQVAVVRAALGQAENHRMKERLTE